MPMKNGRKHEVGLLRAIVKNLATRPLPDGPITQEVLLQHGFERVVRRSGALAGVLRPGRDQFDQLCVAMFKRSPQIERGVALDTYRSEFLEALLTDLLGRSIDSLRESDVVALEKHLVDWFDDRAPDRKLFVPCIISRWASPRISVGSVSFIFIKDVHNNEFKPSVPRHCF